MISGAVSLLVAAVCAAIGWAVKRWLGSAFPATTPAQAAVNTERKMAQDVVNSPSQAEAVRALRNGEI